MANIYDLSDTWNDGGTTFNAIKMNVTDTASAAGAVYNKTGSALLELATDGDTKFWVGKNGGLWLKTGESGGAGRSIAGIGSAGTEVWNIQGNGTALFANITSNGFLACNRFVLSSQVELYSGAANVLDQRNSTNAQTFNLYNTYTDASNYERGFMKWNSNVLEIGTEAAGTGVNRSFALLSVGNISYRATTSASHIFGAASGDVLSIQTGSAVVGLRSTASLGWTSNAASGNGAPDVGLVRDAATIIRVTNGSTGGGAMQMTEMTAPAAPAANAVRIYAEDDGAGKTRLMARFATGAAVQIAIEP